MNFGVIKLTQKIRAIQNSFIIHFKTEDFYEDIADNVEKDSIHQIMKSTDHWLQERIKKL